MSGDISVPELLQKKKNGDELTPEEIHLFIQRVVTGTAQDCQIGNISINLASTVKAET
jgi:thymidine phosphorylase